MSLQRQLIQHFDPTPEKRNSGKGGAKSKQKQFEINQKITNYIDNARL